MAELDEVVVGAFLGGRPVAVFELEVEDLVEAGEDGGVEYFGGVG